jgi:hypothetical protein
MGLTWTQTILPDVIYAIQFPSQNTGYASADGKMYKTTDAGNTWRPTYCISAWAPQGIYFINDNTGWAVGFHSTVIKTTTGGGELIGINPVSNEIPKSFLLYQNYPNPFNPVTKISFDIPANAYVELKVYDILGREITVLVNEQLTAGIYSVDFDGSYLPSGVYFYRLVTGSYFDARKMVLIK